MENAKIVISTDADKDLEKMVLAVNDGFQAGRVRKNELASWIIRFFEDGHFAKQIQAIRSDHFDEVAHLESVIKQIKAARDGEGSVELNSLLAPVLQRQKTVLPRPIKKAIADKSAKETE